MNTGTKKKRWKSTSWNIYYLVFEIYQLSIRFHKMFFVYEYQLSTKIDLKWTYFL
jgi:hypothetical protein